MKRTATAKQTRAKCLTTRGLRWRHASATADSRVEMWGPAEASTERADVNGQWFRETTFQDRAP